MKKSPNINSSGKHCLLLCLLFGILWLLNGGASTAIAGDHLDNTAEPSATIEIQPRVAVARTQTATTSAQRVLQPTNPPAGVEQLEMLERSLKFVQHHAQLLPVPPAPGPQQPDNGSLPSTDDRVFSGDVVAHAEATQHPESLGELVPVGAQNDLPVIVPQPIRRPSYVDVYRSIPFIRSEYEANPSYRHEAAMELLFGQLRPTTVVKYLPPPMSLQPAYVTPYSYTRRGYRVNYNFYYPRPTVYRRY